MNNIDILVRLEGHIAKYTEFSNAVASMTSTLMQILGAQKGINKTFYDQLCAHIQTFNSIQQYIKDVNKLMESHKAIAIDHEQRIKNLEERGRFDAPPKFNPPRSH